MSGSRKTFLSFLASVVILILPFVVSGTDENFKKEYASAATSISNFLNPDKWFEILKRNITIPISKEQVVNIPTPEEALRQSSPQLREIGRGVREETGLDLAKFISWIVKVLKVFFQIIVKILETVAGALN